MAIKIDLEKAYDKLQWSSIDVVLKEINLLELVHRIVMEYITTLTLDFL